MKISENGLMFIKKFEGFSAVPYLCPAGKTTIGYGHVIKDGEKFPFKINEHQRQEILRLDIAMAEEAVNDLVCVNINQNQFDALVSIAYNIGITALKNSTLIRLINIGKTESAAAEFNRWVYAAGKKQAGLVRRREEEKELFSLNN